MANVFSHIFACVRDFGRTHLSVCYIADYSPG